MAGWDDLEKEDSSVAGAGAAVAGGGWGGLESEPAPPWWQRAKEGMETVTEHPVVKEVLEAPMNTAGMLWNMATGWIPPAVRMASAPVFGDILGYSDWGTRAKELEGRVGNALTYQPQTEGGQLAQDIAFSPFSLINKPGEWVRSSADEAGYPNLGEVLESGWQAGTGIMVPWAARKVTGVGAPKLTKAQVDPLVGKMVEEGMTQGVMPSGLKDFRQRQQYMKRASDVVADIVDNKDSTPLTKSTKKGDVEITGRVPQTLLQFMEAIDKGKHRVWSTAHDMLMKTNGVGLQVPLDYVAQQLEAFAGDRVLATRSPKLAKRASDWAARYRETGTLTLPEIERDLAMSNEKLKAYYKNPSFERATQAAVEEVVASALRKTLDDVITTYEGPGYQNLRNKYGAYKAIEADVAKRAGVDANKRPIGFFGYGALIEGAEMARAVTNLDPSHAVTAGVYHIVRQTINKINNPNTHIARMFDNVDKARGKMAVRPEPQVYDTSFAESLLEPVSIRPNTPIPGTPLTLELPRRQTWERRDYAKAPLQQPRPANSLGSYADAFRAKEVKGVAEPGVPRGVSTFREAGNTLMRETPKPGARRQVVVEPKTKPYVQQGPKTPRGKLPGGLGPKHPGEVLFDIENDPLQLFRGD